MKFLKSIALVGALLMVPFAAQANELLNTGKALFSSGAATIGIAGGGAVEEGVGLTATLEFARDLRETGVYASFTFIDDADVELTSYVLGASFGTGTSFKPRFGLAYNELDVSYPDDIEEVGADIGFLWLSNSWWVVSGGYNTSLDVTSVGVGVQW